MCSGHGGVQGIDGAAALPPIPGRLSRDAFPVPQPALAKKQWRAATAAPLWNRESLCIPSSPSHRVPKADREAAMPKPMADGESRELSKEQVLAALKERGITDVDALAQKLRDALRSQGEGAPQPATLMDQDIPGGPRSKSAVEVRHRSPGVPLLVDGVQYASAEISRFDGRPLHFILTSTAAREPVLVAFTTFSPVLSYLRSTLVEAQIGVSHHKTKLCWFYSRDPVTGYFTAYQYPCGIEPHEEPKPPPPPPPPPPPSLVATFHEHFHQTSRKASGNSITLQPNFFYADLTKVHMSGLWPFDSDWNDKISGVTLDGATVVCAEHGNLEGSTIVLGPPGGNVIDLFPLGWNDRISSMWNVGAVL